MFYSLKIFRNFFIIGLLSLSGFYLQAKTLDDILVEIQNDAQHDPFLMGASGATQQAVWPEIQDFAQKFKTEIKWVPSVAKEVLKLPFNEDRMVVQKTDDFDGWFDEFATPNLVIVENKAAFITVLHELRHAVHLGNHGLTAGTWYDRLLQQNKRRINRFQERLAASDLSEETKKRLKHLSTRLVETCSEVSAHQGDVMLSLQFGHEDIAESYLEYIRDYKNEFLQAFRTLKKNPFSQNEPFVDELYNGLQKFILEKQIRVRGLKNLTDETARTAPVRCESLFN